MSDEIIKLELIQINEYAMSTGEIRKELRLDFNNDTHFVTDIQNNDRLEAVVSKLNDLVHTILSINN